MPIYKYKCAAGHETEANVKMLDYKETVACSSPDCKSKALRDYTGQNILGIVQGGTRGGSYNLRKSYHGKKIDIG